LVIVLFLLVPEIFFPQKVVVFNNFVVLNGYPFVTVLKISFSCNNGFVLDPNMTCAAFDFCANSSTHSCSKSPIRPCINNLDGTYSCGACPSGYSISGLLDCVDIDECNTGTHTCSLNPVRPCINTNGTYSCGSCPSGYAPTDAFNCADINECITGNHLCQKVPVARTCRNGEGNYSCDPCPSLYEDSGPYNCSLISTTQTAKPTTDDTTAPNTGTTAPNTGTTASTTETTQTTQTTENTENGKPPGPQPLNPADGTSMLVTILMLFGILLI